MTDFKKPIEDLAGDIREYVDLKSDDIKLKATKGLSVSIARVLSALVLLFVLGLLIITLTVAFVLGIGHLTGNYAIGALIASGLFLAAFVILFIQRKKLFTDSFVSMFIQIFFPEDEEEQN